MDLYRKSFGLLTFTSFTRALPVFIIAGLAAGCSVELQRPQSADAEVVTSEANAIPAQPTEEERQAQVQAELKLRDDRMRAAEELAEQRATAARQAEESARLEREAQAIALRETQRRREQEAEQAAEQALRAQETEIARLEAQIEVNNTVTELIDSANDALVDTIAAAENLSAALNTEGEKYAEVNPDSGLTTQELNKQQLEQLEQELARLRTRSTQLNNESR